MVISSDHKHFIEYFFTQGGKSKFRGDFVMIWHVIVFSIWRFMMIFSKLEYFCVCMFLDREDVNSCSFSN